MILDQQNSPPLEGAIVFPIFPFRTAIPQQPKELVIIVGNSTYPKGINIQGIGKSSS